MHSLLFQHFRDEYCAVKEGILYRPWLHEAILDATYNVTATA